MIARFVPLALALAALSAPARGQTLQGYAHESDLGVRNERWMERLPDERRYSNLSLPGTHDSISRRGGDIGATQTLPLGIQLQVGIRAFDIRLRCKDSVLKGYHKISQDITFDEILGAMTSFLAGHGGETLYVRISNDAGTDDCGGGVGWQDLFDRAYNDPRWSGWFWKPPEGVNENTDPSLRITRGKIVVLESFARHYQSRTFPPYGLPYRGDRCQDYWALNGILDLHHKWEKVKDALTQAALPYDQRDAKFRFLVCNYLSGSYDGRLVVMPYFVASGHSSHETNAPRLSTGLSGPRQKFHYTYPDFPRHEYGTKRNPQVTILYEGTNVLAMHWLRNHHPGYTGIVFMDFPGRDLIAEIILANQNFR